MDPSTRPELSPLARAVAGAVAAAAVGLLAACSTPPQVQAQWTDPQLGANSTLMRGSRVLVACQADDVAVRQVCQDQLGAELTARGVTPVIAPPDTALLADRPVDGQLLPAARSASARALFVVTLAPAATDVSPGVSIGLGGFGGLGRSGSVGVGISAPLGGGRVTTGYSANGRVTDAESGKLVWTASAAAPPSGDLPAQFSALARVVVEAAARSGLF